MPIELAPLTTAAPAAIEALLDAAFGADRRARTAYRLREGMEWVPELSFAVLEGEGLVGCLQSWPAALSGVPLVLVGPVAVMPGRQGAGLGKTLMQALVEAAGDAPLVMIGDPEYYGRWNFTADATANWTLPGPVERRRLLARSVAHLPRQGALGPRLAIRALAA